MRRSPPLSIPVVCLALAALLAGCATPAPVVYQRPGTDARTAARIDADTQSCRQLAEQTVGLNGRSGRQTGREAGKAASIGFAGAAAGAVAGASRDTWQRARSAAAAGAAGMLTRLLLDWNEPDDVHQEYVERCMKDRGHHVLGWR